MVPSISRKATVSYNQSYHMQNKIYYLLLLIFFSCEKEQKSAYTVENAKIDSAIKEERIFLELDWAKDVAYGADSIGKKTSNVLSYFKWKEEVEIPPFHSTNNCRAAIINDTLVIRIGSTTYLSDIGIEIKYKNGKYYAVPFSTSDIYDSSQPKRKTKEIFFLRDRKLILNQKNYKTGDSVFGRIHLEIEEPKRGKYTVEYFADGFFRSSVSEL